ncbi:hypothetical protein WN51_05736 [Melipona quadrifasciata]|uniref:Uncharacterized protein n=1 Tax=Melipona quadrifasciata TaxID=166423 RepID=A0A0M9A5U8_9HYME|nr:hypothetical protein WN51_05736 [Melipona quadrifasciata]
MERVVSTDDSCSKRLSTITEYSEPGIDSDDNEERCEEEPAIPRGDSEQRLEDQASTAVKYFLVDDSPMAKFSRSIKWIYKKTVSQRKRLEAFSALDDNNVPSSMLNFAQITELEDLHCWGNSCGCEIDNVKFTPQVAIESPRQCEERIKLPSLTNLQRSPGFSHELHGFIRSMKLTRRSPGFPSRCLESIESNSRADFRTLVTETGRLVVPSREESREPPWSLALQLATWIIRAKSRNFLCTPRHPSLPVIRSLEVGGRRCARSIVFCVSLHAFRDEGQIMEGRYARSPLADVIMPGQSGGNRDLSGQTTDYYVRLLGYARHNPERRCL